MEDEALPKTPKIFEISKSNRFRIETSVQLDEKDYDTTADAVDTVLTGHHKPWPYENPLRLIFEQTHVGVDGTIVAGELVFNPQRIDQSSIHIGLEEIDNAAKLLGVDRNVMLTLIASHEGRHLLQLLSGEDLTGVPHTDPKHETEAWESALHVIKKAYPSANGTISIGTGPGAGSYAIPPKSMYS